MNIKVVFFASIRESLDCSGLEIPFAELPENCTVQQLLARLLTGRDDAWREALTAENVRIALNQELITGDPALGPGDEVAFFPPVTGG